MAFQLSDGEAQEIINRTDALEVAESSGLAGYIVDVDGGQIRLASADRRESIEHGFPVPGNTTFTINPLKNRIYAYADGSAVTVTTMPLEFQIGEVVR